MRDELTCWDALRHRGFTGQEAALAIVGQPPTDDTATNAKAALVLELMRHNYEQAREWFAIPQREQEKLKPPEVLLVSEAMQDVREGNLVMRDATIAGDHPYCAWPRLTEQVPILFAGEIQRKVSAIGFIAWSLSKLADFDRQTFTRDVLAHWVQEVGASTLYPFTRVVTPPSGAADHTLAPATGHEPAAVVLQHTTKGTRRDILTPVIEHAQNLCKDPQDTAEVWGRLHTLSNEQHSVLLHGEGKAIAYTEGDETKFLTRKKLRDRLRNKKA